MNWGAGDVTADGRQILIKDRCAREGGKGGVGGGA